MSNDNELLAIRLALGRGTLRTKLLTDFVKNSHRTKEESINSFKSGLADLVKEYNVAYQQVDIIEKEETLFLCEIERLLCLYY